MGKGKGGVGWTAVHGIATPTKIAPTGLLTEPETTVLIGLVPDRYDGRETKELTVRKADFH